MSRSAGPYTYDQQRGMKHLSTRLALRRHIEFRNRRLFAFVRPSKTGEFLKIRYPVVVYQNDVVMGHIDHSAYFDHSPLPSDEIELIGTGLMEAQGLSLIDSGFGTCNYFHRHCPKGLPH